MSLAETISTSFEALALNKLRTGLAMLGIVIGIGAVIALVSLGQAGQKAIESQIQSLGSNLLTVIPGALRPGDIRSASGTSTTLTLDDAKAIAANKSLTGVTLVSAEILRRAQITAGRNNTNTQVVGVLPTYQKIRNIDLAAGAFVSEADLSGQAKVAVLGSQTTSDLFGTGANPTGQTIRINKMSFKVTGVAVSKGGGGFQNQDDVIYIPLSTAQKQLFGVDFVGSISVQIAESGLMERARDEVGYFLLQRHKITDPRNADFTIFSQADILNTAQQVTSIFTTLLSGIAAISLLVGGIGIMNIMLVTVVERTREIGLRKALGATSKTVIRQFLIEAILLAIAGGVLGIGLGTGLSLVISRLVNLPFVFSWQATILAVSVSVLVGILFGWYPAKKAAGFSPIEALRFE